MPLVVLAGLPCSGKSGVASRLADLLRAGGHSVALVDEPSLHLERNAAYQTPAQEKAARGALRSAVERAVSRRTTVVLDSLNHVKGYRYELWCRARAAGTHYCLVHVATPADVARGWNDARRAAWRQAQVDEQQAQGNAQQDEEAEAARAPWYTDAVFDDLAGRFETPDARNRWDAPLFTVARPGAADEADVLAAVIAAMTGGRPKPQPQQPQQQSQQQQQPHEAAADGEPPPPMLLHQGAEAKPLQPTAATQNPVLLGTNVLHELDAAAQDVVARILAAQQLAGSSGCGAAGGGGVVLVDLSGSSSAGGDGAGDGGGGDGGGGGARRDVLRLERHVPTAELRRHKRAFLKLATKISSSRLRDAASARRAFAEFLRSQLQEGLAGGGSGGGSGGGGGGFL